MCKQYIFIDVKKWCKATLFVAGSILSQFVMAESPIGNTPVNQSDYELQHQGRLQINAILFNSPCNLYFDNTLRLTGCGAGKEFHEINLFDTSEITPVSVQFYDVQSGMTSKRYSLSLLNGNNPIHLPKIMRDRHILRLEVSYE